MTTFSNFGRRARASWLGVVVSGAVLVTGCADGAGGGESKVPGGAVHELVGNPAPAFSVASVNGKGTVDTEKLKGKVLFVDFWATWCEPCKKSFPKLQELNVKYKASGLVIVGISQDDENQGLSDFGKQFGADFPLAWDKDKAIAKQWGPKSMPSSFLVDKTGIVRNAHLGWHDGDEEELDREIKALLQ
jgi:peroxiredoxin